MSKKQRDQLYVEVMRHQATPQPDPNEQYLAQYSQISPYMGLPPNYQPHAGSHAAALHSMRNRNSSIWFIFMTHLLWVIVNESYNIDIIYFWTEKSNFNPNHLHLMQQHLPQTPTMPFPVKHENLQDSYYQQQLNQEPIMAPISPPAAVSSPPSIQIPAPRSSPVGKYMFFFRIIFGLPGLLFWHTI